MRFPHPAARIAFLLVGLAVAMARPPVVAGADDLQEDVERIWLSYRADLEELAAWCDGQGLAEEARKTRRWQRTPDPYRYRLAVFPSEIGKSTVGDDASVSVAEWDRRLGVLKRKHSTALFDLSRRAMRLRRASMAIDLLLAALRENPDNEPLREMLGYQAYVGQWMTNFEIGLLRRNMVEHPRFGWIPKTHVQRYDRGERYLVGRWISAAEDARRHANIHAGWTIQTRHYEVRTNHGLEAGVQLGRKLEVLREVWTRLFVRYFMTEPQVAAMFNGRARSQSGSARKLGVVFFRTRQEYNEALRDSFPNIEISVGIFVQNNRRAYFFAGTEYDRRTMLHEATHQLFHGSRPVSSTGGLRANFWIIEGIAMFMESLRREEDSYILGGSDDARFHAARYRLLVDDFYIPLDKFCEMGMQDIQRHPRVATLYSQAAGLTHFLIFHDSGRYRDALVAYLVAVYTGRDTPQTLSQLTGVSYAELDRQYLAFMRAAPEPEEVRE